MNEPGGNAAVVRSIIRAFGQGGVESMLDLIDEDVEAVIRPEVSAEPDVYRGYDGIRRYFAGFTGVLEDVRFELGELVEEGDHVLVPVRLVGRGVTSGLEAELPSVGLWEIRDGRLVRMEAFPDIESARAALRSRFE